MGVHKYAPICAVQAEMGWMRCREGRKLIIIRFWNRCIKMENCKITKTLFLKNIDHKLTWSNSIEHILEDLGMNDII